MRSSHHSNYLESQCSRRCSRPIFLGPGIISQLSVALSQGYSANIPEIPHSRFLSLSVLLAQQMSHVEKSSTSVSLFQLFRNIPWPSSLVTFTHLTLPLSALATYIHLMFSGKATLCYSVSRQLRETEVTRYCSLAPVLKASL